MPLAGGFEPQFCFSKLKAVRMKSDDTGTYLSVQEVLGQPGYEYLTPNVKPDQHTFLSLFSPFFSPLLASALFGQV